MKMTAIVVLLLITAFLNVVLRKYQPETALGVGIVAGVVVLAALLSQLLPVLNELREMLDEAALPHTYVDILFKALGICLLTQFSADACRDAGETALGAKAELVGKVMLMILALPLFREITRLALSLAQGAL